VNRALHAVALTLGSAVGLLVVLTVYALAAPHPGTPIPEPGTAPTATVQA